jgi:hypothetical protein
MAMSFMGEGADFKQQQLFGMRHSRISQDILTEKQHLKTNQQIARK